MRIVSGAVSVVLNGGGLGTGEPDISVMLLFPVLHGSSSLAAAFTGNSVNNAVPF